MKNLFSLHRNKLESILVYLPVIFIMMGLYNLPNGRSLESKLLVISSLFLILFFRKKIHPPFKNRSLTFLIVSIVVYLLWGMFSVYFHGDDKGLIRGGFICLAFLLFTPLFTKTKPIQFSAIIGSFIMLVIALYQLIVNKEMRIDAFTNAIPYSYGTIVIALFNLYFIFISKIKTEKIFHFIAVITALTCTLLSDSRGTWIAIPINIIVFIAYLNKYHSKKVVSLSILAFFLISLPATFLFKDRIEARYDQAISNVNQYNNGNPNTSIGTRLMLWDSSYQIFKTSPILGRGYKYKEDRKEQVNNGLFPPQIMRWTHNHNQYVETAITRGSVGLFTFLILFLASFIAVNKSQATPELKSLGYSIILSFMIFSLTDVPFKHHITLYLYLVSLTYIVKFQKLSY
ncbi:O-antigen ligase family protein [Photobacterium swingsii]|uniref:O-antigen ligase family protein n=1 Tax=Photobacterium swingsii TaxID=680026 RepID=UPI004067D8C1